MGTWGEGLYDNDGALDALPLHGGAVPMATTVGLTAWLRPAATERIVEAVQQQHDWVTTLPAQAQDLLGSLTRDPKSFCKPRSRSPKLTEIIGGYSGGHRYDALLTLPGSEKVLDQLGTAAAERLDDGLRTATDLHEASSAVGCLGVLLEMAGPEYWSPRREALNEWRRNLDRLYDETLDEREFWDDYVSRVRRGLRLLKASRAGGDV